MNSNWKLLPATLLVAVLALAGCGGGGDSTPTGPTPEEEANQRADEAEQRADQAEADLEAERQRQADEKAAADAKAAQEAAETLRRVLATAISGAADSTATDNPVTDYVVTVAAAGPAGLKDNDAYKSMTVSVMGKPFNKEYTSISDGVVTLVDADTEQDAFPVSRYDVPAFGTSGTKTHIHNGVTSNGTARFTTTGSYHGVAGTFTCTGTCTSTWTTADALDLGGTWTFKPDNPSANVMDGNAVQYGWWTNDLGKTATEVARVYYGPKDMNAFEYAGGGTATYKGSAVGQYAVHRGAGAENDSGMFTADATLNADFGTDAEISGMIDGFMGADGMARDWMVELRAATIATGAWADGMTVWTMGGDKGSVGGNWRGATYGPGDTPDTGMTPAAVAGSFSAVHGNIGNMIGAYGADVEE